jgi:putative flippase GtrA
MLKISISVAALYTLFAAFSALINIGIQMVSIWSYKGSYSVELSILIGTAVGLPLRYLLEKRHIFAYKSNNAAHDRKLFLHYCFMGMLTTIIFWGVEYGFHLIFATDTMRYMGGMIGLVIGFYVKYQLDKKYVFVSGNNQVAL